tara:strand:- start:29 stop:223 length:195 start_codon:yes stop_codon:yes gene_type:complete
MESSEIHELVKVLIRQRDSAMSHCAELEAQLIIAHRHLEKYKNEEEAQDLFKSKNGNQVDGSRL